MELKQFDFRFYNSYGFGLIKYEYNDKTATRSHPRPTASMSTGSTGYVNKNFDQLEDANFYLSDNLRDELSVTFQIVKFMSPKSMSNNINLEILNAKFCFSDRKWNRKFIINLKEWQSTDDLSQFLFIRIQIRKLKFIFQDISLKQLSVR